MQRVHSGFLKLAVTVSILLCTSIVVTPVNASWVDFNFAGSVDSISSGLSGFSLGQKMSGLIKYDTTITSDSDSSPVVGQYDGAITGGHVQFSGGYSASLANSPDSFINIRQIGNFDVYTLQAPVAGSPLDYLEVTIIHFPSAFSNTLFPPTLGSIASAQFRLVFGNGGPKEVSGPLTAVPLPPAVILFGAGLVALAGMGRLRYRPKAEGSELRWTGGQDPLVGTTRRALRANGSCPPS